MLLPQYYNQLFSYEFKPPKLKILKTQRLDSESLGIRLYYKLELLDREGEKYAIYILRYPNGYYARIAEEISARYYTGRILNSNTPSDAKKETLELLRNRGAVYFKKSNLRPSIEFSKISKDDIYHIAKQMRPVLVARKNKYQNKYQLK
jgi:hypothetical protein